MNRMSRFKNNYETQLDYESKSKILEGFIPRELHESQMVKMDGKVYFSIYIVSKYLVHLKKESIINRKKAKLMFQEYFLDTTAIDEILVDCNTSDNKFRTIEINKELGRVVVKENKRYKKRLGTSVYEVNDDLSSIKYTKEARFLYAVNKYLQYLKHDTKEKVFLNELELIDPQYKDIKNDFRYDLYIPSAKICIEYLEEGHYTSPEKIKQDLIRKQVIEYEDVLVMSYNYIQSENDADVYLSNFLLSLKDNIVERSLYFTSDEITMDQYLYVFQKNGISNIEIAEKMLEIRNKDESEIDIPLEDAFDMILLENSNDKDKDKVLSLISNCLDKDEQYTYSKSFDIENIFLNKTGFCDFCVLIGTFQSRKILKYYREVETMCINMINEKVKYIKEQREKKENFREVVEKLHRDNWTYQVQVDANVWKRKYNDLLKSSNEEIKFNRKRNQEQKRALVKIKNLIDKVGAKKIGNLRFKNETVNAFEEIKFLKKEKGIVMLEDEKPVFPEFNCLVYIEEDDIDPVYLSDVVQKYNQYNSCSLTQNDIKKMLEKHAAQIGIVNSSSFSGRSNKPKLTNVRWLTEEELNEEDSDNEDEESDSESELAKSLSETKLSDSNSENSDSEVEIASDEELIY